MFDIIVAGSGPAGLTAAIYAGRFNRKALVIGEEPGGATFKAWVIENYPGFDMIKGPELVDKMESQAKAVGAEIKYGAIKSIKKIHGIFSVETDNDRFESKAIILATGTKHRKLNLPKEEELVGHGIAYCATCDAAFYKGKTVAVAGGGDTGVKSALILNQFTDKIYIMTDEKAIRAEPINLDKVAGSPIKILTETVATELIEDGGKLIGLKLSKPYEGKAILPVDGLFVEIGSDPSTELAQQLGVKINKWGFIDTNSDDMKTNVEGVFAAGDCTGTFGTFKQIITAAATGAVAANTAHGYLNNLKN